MILADLVAADTAMSELWPRLPYRVAITGFHHHLGVFTKAEADHG